MRVVVLLLAVAFEAVIGDYRAATIAVPAREPASSSIRVVRDVPLPPNLRWARDVRFESDSTVLLAAGRAGVLRFDLRDSKATTVVPGSGMGSFFFSVHLGRTRQTLLVASAFGALTWRDAGGRLQDPFPFELIVDVDAFGDRVALIGARRDERGRWNSEKGVVWTGTLSSKLKDLTPLITTKEPPASDPINRCHCLELGAVRYLKDGSLLVVPGVQPGVFLYAPDGRLKRTWESGPFGFYDDCDLSSDEVRVFQAQLIPRWKWLAKHAVLDEVLDLQGGPALVIRKVEKGETVWDLVRLDEKSPAERLPFRSHSSFAHLRADVRGQNVVFLVIEYSLPEDPPPAPPRVITAEVSR